MNDFGRLVEAEIPRLRRYARALTRDAVRADDLVQSCLTRAVAKDAILQGIRVNAIAPGFTDTPLLDVLTPLLRGSLAVQTPVGRMGTVDEIAAVAVFLASDRAGFFVGETLSPNGGYLTV